MTIFLDFDGVFTTDHNWATEDDRIDRKAFSCLATMFEQQRCQIVVTSTWRSGHSLDELREILSPLDAEVIGVMPVLSNRGEEIIAWIAAHFGGDQYLVIDDEVAEIRPYIDDDHIVHVQDGFTKGASKPSTWSEPWPC
ncbi:MAG: HAD domain-containing protein [Bacteroidota bacterium]